MDLIQVRRDLHKIPELGFQEVKTQRYLKKVISDMATDRVQLTEWRTGLVAKVTGTASKRTLGWRTDIDGLPIQEATGLPFASQHEGFMHACGHDVHMSIALGLLAKLIEQPIKDDVVMIFQPAEEGPGGAEPLLAWLEQERPDLLPDQMFALHIAPELPVGTVATKPGLLFANTSELFIDLRGKGGHAAFPHQTRDMAVAAAALLMQLQTVVSRNVDPMDSAVLTVGKMTAGTVQNIIAENARLEGTIRTLTPDSMKRVKKRIESLCRSIEEGYECSVVIDYGASYRQVDNDTELAESFLAYANNDPRIIAVRSEAAMTGEDFGYFTGRLPGLMFWAGVGSPFGLHHAKLVPDETILDFMPDFLYNYFKAL